MTLLPIEIVSYIFEHIPPYDSVTLGRICLLNSSWHKQYMPVLYKCVTLSDTEQVKQFNSLVESSPQVCKWIEVMTLENSSEYVPLRQQTDWIDHWKLLIDILSKLSEFSLSTLILRRDAFQRLQYNRYDGVQVLGNHLKQTKIVIDNLWVAHGDVRFILARIRAKRIRWKECQWGSDPISSGSLMDVNRSQRKKDELLYTNNEGDIRYLYPPTGDMEYTQVKELQFAREYIILCLCTTASKRQAYTTFRNSA
jgi:hypothetical protein